jgi:transcription elongation factor Elf1
MSDKAPEPCPCCNHDEAFFWGLGQDRGWVRLTCNRCGHRWHWKNTKESRVEALKRMIQELEDK